MTRPHQCLVVPLALMGLLVVPGHAFAATQTYCNFPSSLTTFTYNGDAFQSSNLIRLTTASTPTEASSAFITVPIAIGAGVSFHAFFRFQMGPSATGGDGLAFVLQSTPAGAKALGGPGAAMGYGGIDAGVDGGASAPRVVAVEFDTYLNMAVDGGGDPNANHVGLMLTDTPSAHAAWGAPGFTMAGAGPLNAWVDYDGVHNTIAAYLSTTSTKPASPLFQSPLNLGAQLGSQMYIGFTAATGSGPDAGEQNRHDVLELEFNTDGFPCGCDGSSVCPTTAPVCNVPLNECVGCLANSDCPATASICDTTSLTCRACTAADCGGSAPVCATTGGNAGSCVLCAADADCPSGTPRCTPSNTCVQCLTSSDCGGGTPLCRAGVCQGCSSDADCGGTTPACEVWGACGQCSATNATQCVNATGVCDYPTGTCVNCEFNTDCAGSTPACNTQTHTCQACQSDTDCADSPTGSVCAKTGMKLGSCLVCAADADCIDSATPRCDTTSNTCVSCLTSSDCAAPAPECNSSHLCVGCLSSADCSGSTPVCETQTSTCKSCQNDYAQTNAGPLSCPSPTAAACQPGGVPLAGKCALCSSLNNTACAALTATPVCISATATCGCAKDTDCAAGSYCDASSTSTGVCTAGCRTLSGQNNCATGEYCDGADGGVGACHGEPCNSNTDCHAPTAVCNTIGMLHVCVQCLNNVDCAAGQVCDTSQHCVECTANQKKSCTSVGKGPLCLAAETCGCAADSDCYNGTEARVCDATQHVCVAGCRGTGGTACTAPQTCSSADTTVGVCRAPAGTTGSSSTGAGGSSSGTGGKGGAGPASGIVAQAQGGGCRVAPGARANRLGELLGLMTAVGLLLRGRGRRAARAASKRRP